MKLDIDGIQAFVFIARLGSFQRAASELRLDQTALTRRMQRLEGYLGLKLLDRTTRSVHLTKIGREFLPQAERLIEELTQSVNRLKGVSRSSSGDVAIACLAFLAYQWLPGIVRTYADAHPQNRVRIVDTDATQVTESVKLGRADFGINIMTAREAALDEHPLVEDPYVLFCPVGHPLDSDKRVTWDKLRGYDLITMPDASESRILISHQLVRQRLDIRGRFEVGHLATALGLVSAGLGAAILPASTLWTNIPMMRQIPLVNPLIKRRVGLIKRRGMSLSPAAQALYDLVKEKLEQMRT
jgi:DNA-binding transcriptional LysR family regulator